MASILPFILLLHVSGTISMCYATTPKFPAVLVFGDSTVDTGNNNYISTLLKSNHSPYGIEFAGGVATGRFSDGMLTPDMLASELGIKKLVPPFLDPSLSDDDIRTGVCFASAGSGFDDLTATVSWVIPVSRQLEMFRQYLNRIKGIVGEQEASKIISNALILIGAGTNDFIFNFYDIPTRRLAFTTSSYQDFVQQRLQDTVKEIYNLGGRKFAVAGLPPIGCLPIQISAKFNYQYHRTCVVEQNSDAVIYNSKLVKLLPEIQSSLPESRIVYSNIYDPLMDMLNNPLKYGFEETLKGCCGTGFTETGSQCNQWTPHCTDPSKFLFWDAVHPTEAAYKPMAKNILDTITSQLY